MLVFERFIFTPGNVGMGLTEPKFQTFQRTVVAIVRQMGNGTPWQNVPRTLVFCTEENAGKTYHSIRHRMVDLPIKLESPNPMKKYFREGISIKSTTTTISGVGAHAMLIPDKLLT
ncbi:hypothetical protein V6N13_120676 [Hibiscus sabdariffa]|uniref:Uncharacterized protein n=1 Tax=Hibiscus sabdariffa TaxID=183260 RepID=A0ABR2E5E9_9ROSI